ncbi:MAG TPA: hypothetical protein VIT42_03555 [Microlunatus sp.]
MNLDPALPVLSFVLPASNENRWSDLLASLIATDPLPIARLLGITCDAVRREVVVPGQLAHTSDRLDLLLVNGGREVAAIEVKLLSDLGHQQLARYTTAFPSVEIYRVLHLERLPVNLQSAEPWKSLTWESVLRAYASSEHAWVSTTATAWSRELDMLVPPVGAHTIWNHVPDDVAGFELALRARVAWLASRLDSWCELEHDIAQSSGGGNWAVRMWSATSTADHYVTAELQEGLTAYEWKADPFRTYRDRLPGPVVLLGLRQEGATTSADFDWPRLHRMFAEHIIDEAGSPRDDRAWHTTAARPTDPTDKENWQRIVQAGAPRWLGKGWGMKVAKSTRSCLFGARFGLPPSSTLGEIDDELRRLQPLLVQMAAT